MRRRGDDLAPFREDPVFKALTAPATDAELIDQALAVEAFQAAAAAQPPRRSAARVAAGGSIAVVLLGLSGGVAAAYTDSLPRSWQQKLHSEISSIPAPKLAHPKTSSSVPLVPAPSPSTPVVPTAPATPAATRPPHSTPTPSASTLPSSPAATPSLPVVVTTSSPPTPSPSPSSSQTAPAATSGLTMSISPGNRVTVGTDLTVNGHLASADGTPVAGRRVILLERLVGEPGWRRLGTPVETSASGAVTFSVPAVQHNVRLVLRARPHLRSAVQEVVVTPVIHVQVAPSARGASSTTVTVSVTGGEPGDVVVVRQEGASSGQRGTLDGSLSATFTVPVSQHSVIHYRVLVPRTKAHAAHSLPFYVPPSEPG